MMRTTTPATFAFSDEELLDALTNIDDSDDSVGAVDFVGFDKLPVAAVAQESCFAHESFTSMLSSGSSSHCGVDLDSSGSTDSSSEQGSTADLESVANESCLSSSALGKPSRKRRKHELDAMRALATTLESQLTSLKKRHHHEQPGTNLFWKRVADQLLLDRQRATAEKARLMDIFHDQAKVLKSIQRSIQKSPDLAKLGVTPSLDAPLNISNSPDLYSRLFEEVSHAYAGTDKILEKAGVAKDAESLRRVNMEMKTEDGRSVMTMEVSESKVVPFDVSAVGEGVWDFLGNNECLDTSETFKRSFQARGDDMFGVVKIGCDLGLFSLTGDIAVRRFIEGRRQSYVWECVGRCDNVRDPANSFRLQEKGWVVFEPSPTDPKKSIFRSCVQFIPQPMNPSEELGTMAKDVGLATEVALSVYEKTIGFLFENVLAELMNDVSVC